MTDISFELIRDRARSDVRNGVAWFRSNWAEKRWFRWVMPALGLALLGFLTMYIAITRDLPDVRTLRDYEPPLPTVVRGYDGEIVHSYARDRRVQLQYADLPKPLIDAFLAAEDKTFFSHGGIDAGGLLGAVVDYTSKLGSNERAVGGSTITQQVAKNIFLSKEYSITRKLREMVLARRIEGVLSKEEILELYLNEIPLGRRSFGVQAAARTYFDKDVGDLALHEAAYLAILPKAPETYSRSKNFDQAIERRNFVLDQMASNDFITADEAAKAKAQPLGIVETRSLQSADAGYFLEEVRRQLLDEFGETAEDGPNSIYAGGLWVRTSLDTKLQTAARDALRKGLLRYHGGRGWSGPLATINFDDGPWAQQLASSPLGINYQGWRVGVVTERSGARATVGFANGDTSPLSNLPQALKAGDVIAVRKAGQSYAVATLPSVSGGFVAQMPTSGRILALQGGFDSRLASFNRATQAKRQPGSTIKPFVYATGLDNGFTPASEVPDQPFCYYQGSRLGEKCFRNSGGGGGGIHTMRWGLEQSRNLMTVHIAMESGMPKVIDTFKKMGIGSYEPYPAFALGAGETTVMQMVNAYSALANHGRLNRPTLIDYVQDRRGKVIWRADKRDCKRCNMPQWDGKPMPRFGLTGKQAMDPRTAYQIVHMLEGVVQRGTGTVLRSLEMPMFGKTGTTTGPTDVWFVGGTSDLIAGTYVGYDTPRNLGGYAQGGTVAAPIIKDFFEKAKPKLRPEPFVAPDGVRLVRVDRLSGKRVFDAWPDDDPKGAVIWEAFKPDTEPPRATRRDEIEAKRQEILDLIRRGSRGARTEQEGVVEAPKEDFVEDQGGIY